MNRPTYLHPSLFLAILFTGCSLFGSEPEPEPEPLVFEEMEIMYLKNGGWIDTFVLTVLPSGRAEAKILAHSSRDTLKKSSAILTEEQKESLANRFAFFERYNRHYSPKIHVTDQNFHQIVLTYTGIPDTVSVYHPPGTPLPGSLKALIHELEKMHQSTLEAAE